MSKKITVQNGDLTFDVTTGNIVANVPLLVQEQTTANTDVAGYGQFWVKDDAPNVPMFTDDTGADFNLTASSVGGPSVVSNLKSATLTDTDPGASNFQMSTTNPSTDSIASVNPPACTRPKIGTIPGTNAPGIR